MDQQNRAQRSGGTSQPQQSISRSHAPKVHLHAQNVELEEEVHGPEVIGRNVPVRRDYKELRKLRAIDFYVIIDPLEEEK